MKTIASLMFVMAAAWSAPAAAQATFHCPGPSGTYVSSRPCPANTPAPPANSKSTSAPIYYGPTPEPQQRYEAPAPRVSEAPNHLQYMSGSCASMNDALRTAQSKGLKYETIQQMQVDYRKQCSEEEQEARMKASREGLDKRVEKRQADREAQVSQVQEQQRTAAKQQQCIESRRIIANKKARTDLTEGEKADLARFEENFRSRCS
jgi:hypothetical protein